MKHIALFILSFFTLQLVSADCTNCNYSINNSTYNQNTAYMNGNTTLCVTGDMSINNMNFNGSNNVLCIKSGVTFSASFNPGNVTFNVYGTFNFSGNVNSGVTFNVYSGGILNISNAINSGVINNNAGGTVNMTSQNTSNALTVTNAGNFYYAGGSITSSTITNTANFALTNTGLVNIQGNTVITNSTSGTFTATVPSKVIFNQGSFTNNGIVNFTNVENQESNITNNAGATLTFQQGTFEHGALHNYGAMIVNCPNASTDCSNPCMSMGNKNSGQFTNSGNLTIHGTLCLGAGVIFHNDGTTTVDKNMNLDNGSQWVQGSGGTTTVGGSTTNSGTFSGGNLCSSSTTGTINATQSCGSPATINDINATTCRNTSVSIPIAAAAPSGSTVSWSSLMLINGTDTAKTTSNPPKLTVANTGTYTISYTSSAASVLFVPVTGYTGAPTIKYTIAASSGSTLTYAAATKNINVTVSAPPTKPKASIALP